MARTELRGTRPEHHSKHSEQEDHLTRRSDSRATVCVAVATDALGVIARRSPTTPPGELDGCHAQDGGDGGELARNLR